MSTESLDSYLKSILEDGFPQAFLERSADLVSESGLNLSEMPEVRLYLRYLESVILILTSQDEMVKEQVLKIRTEMSSTHLPKTASQWVDAALIAAGESSLGTISLALGLWSYHVAMHADKPGLFLETFVRGWIDYFKGSNVTPER